MYTTESMPVRFGFQPSILVAASSQDTHILLCLLRTTLIGNANLLCCYCRKQVLTPAACWKKFQRTFLRRSKENQTSLRSIDFPLMALRIERFRFFWAFKKSNSLERGRKQNKTKKFWAALLSVVVKTQHQYI